MTSLIALLIFLAPPSVSYMRDGDDVKISMALIDNFRRECSYKAGVDQAKIIDLQKTFEQVRKDSSEEGKQALTCYQDRMAQITGIHQLYKDLCSEIGSDPINRPEAETLRVLLMTQRYKRGITPFHDLLNDCLQAKSTGKYIVITNRQRSEVGSLREQLEKIKIVKPFEANRVEFR